MAPTTFAPQPLSAPLNDKALGSLRELAQDRDREKRVRLAIKKAVDFLTHTTGDLNDAAFERRARQAKEKARRQAQREENAGAEDTDAGEADTEANRAHDEFQRRVEALTKKMDLSIRALIDDSAYLDEVPDLLARVADQAQESSETSRTGFGVSPTARRSQRLRLEDEDGDREKNEEEQDEDGPIRPPTQRPSLHPSDTPHIHLAAALETRAREWTSKTPTQRYAQNNDYIGWMRTLYDAKNPGESVPPMPSASLWFAAEEGRERGVLPSTHRRGRPAAASTRDAANDASMTEAGDSDDGPGEDDGTGEATAAAADHNNSDDELEIASEKVRLKCPITLLPYVDPVTSKNCNHSYERTAILSMLQSSSDHVAFSPQQLQELALIPTRKDRAARERAMLARMPKLVKCAECNVALQEADLVENPVLKRRAARLLAQERRGIQRDEPGDLLDTSDIDGRDDDDDDVAGLPPRQRGTQRRPLGVGSSPLPPSSSRKKPFKPEPRPSRIPQTQPESSTQLPGSTQNARQMASGAIVLDLEDEGEDDDDDDDEY